MATTSNFEREQAWSAAFVTTTPSDNAKRFASARRHTRVVRFLRRALPVAAVGLVVIYAGIILKTSGWVSGLPQIALPNIIPENLEMANPHYQGFNADGGSYVVNAKTAVQSLTDTSLITLNGITGVLTDANKVKTDLKAVHGLYNSKTEQLELYDGIDVVSENGMHAVMSRATVINKQNIITTKEPVTVQMPTGTVRSKEMTLHNKTREVTFLNAVQTHLIPADDKKSPATPGTAPAAAGAVPGSTPAPPPGGGTPTAQSVPAAAPPTAGAAPMLSVSNGPIDITSNRLDINDNTKVAIFSGNVRAVQAGAALETAGLTVTYEGQNAGTTAALGANSKIRRIVSSTPVVMTRPPHDRVTGKSLDFDALTEVAVITGDVVMTSQADRKVTGAIATIDQKADTVLLVGSVVAIQGRNQLGGERLFVERAKALTHLTSPGDTNGDPGRITSRFYRTDAKASPKASKQWQTAFASGATAAVFKTDPAAPIDIEADRLDVDDHAKEAVYKGDVHAKQGEFQIRTIEMHALYTGQAGLAEQKDAVPAQQQGAQLDAHRGARQSHRHVQGRTQRHRRLGQLRRQVQQSHRRWRCGPDAREEHRARQPAADRHGHRRKRDPERFCARLERHRGARDERHEHRICRAETHDQRAPERDILSPPQRGQGRQGGQRGQGRGRAPDGRPSCNSVVAGNHTIAVGIGH